MSQNELVGYWKWKGQNYEQTHRTSFYLFKDDSTYRFYKDSLSEAILKGTYSVLTIEGESVLLIMLTTSYGTDTSSLIVRKLSPNSFQLRYTRLSQSKQLIFKWEDFSESHSTEFVRLDEKDVYKKPY